MRITLKEEIKLQKMICIFTEDFPLGQFLVSAGANQASSFSISGISIPPNMLFQTINRLKRLMSYSK